MSSSLNKVMLIGTVGRDPEIRTIPNGKKVANFSIAMNESFKDKEGQKVEKTEWAKIVIWGGLAEVVEKYVKQGTSVYVEGKITTRSWDDPEGKKKYATEIVCHSMQLLGGKGQNQQSGDSQRPTADPFQEPEDETLPF
tara:strand:+ start:144 stop:560 length:417 start_codon:yes stop_codon:yes gene_type:complete